jgi:SAM-dependent methyltransferase
VDPTPTAGNFGHVFDDVAEEYDAIRPGYPAELVDAALERGHLRAGSRVLEVGSGTGKLTELLAQRGLVIDAVDPGPNMIDAARRRLGPGAADVRFHLGVFEDVSLPEAAFAALFAAAAFHWVDPTIAWSKAALHLEPGGLLALLLHTGLRDKDTSDEEEEEFRGILRKHAPELADELPRSRDLETILAGAELRSNNASEVWDWLMGGYQGLGTPIAAPLFRDVEVLPLVSRVEYTADELLAHFRTTSLYYRIDPSRRQAFQDDDRRFIERRGGSLQFSQAAILMTAFRR